MGPFISTSFHRESKYKLQSFLFFWHLPTNLPPTLVPNKLLLWLHLFVPTTLGFASQSKIGGGIKMQNDQSVIHGVAILSPIKL